MTSTAIIADAPIDAKQFWLQQQNIDTRCWGMQLSLDAIFAPASEVYAEHVFQLL
jgi:hypothetical protein